MGLWYVLKRMYHFFLAFLGNALYGFPSRKLFLIGITGTKGKSTTVHLLDAILRASGKKTASLSSVGFSLNGEMMPNETGNTMPGRFTIPKFLSDAVKAGCEYAVLEVTSQGVLEHRHRFLDFDSAVFLNLHPEHIEAHGSFEAYRASKVKFFSDTAKHSKKVRKIFLVNEKDSASDYFLKAVEGRGEKHVFNVDHFVQSHLSGNKKALGAWIGSDFNLENAAAASTLAELLRIDFETVRATLSSFKGVPGRLEIVQEEPFRVVVDYAHTAESMRALYQELRHSRAHGRLICIVGSDGGGRDRWKRKEFGKVAAEFCSDIILTEENSYGDDVREILRDIRKGIPGAYTGGVHEIPDRRDAMKFSLRVVRRGDTIVATGKGSESFLKRGKTAKIRWSDRGVFQELLKDRSR